MKKFLSCVLAISMAGCLVACTGSNSEEKNYTVSYSGIATGNVSSGVSVHDPSILEVDGTYYIYGSHMTAAKSDDLLSWKKVADGYNKTNPVYGQIYEVKDQSFAYAGNKDSIKSIKMMLLNKGLVMETYMAFETNIQEYDKS